MLNQIYQHGSAVRRGAGRRRRVFREVNERIAELTRVFNALGVHLLICECSDEGCAESIEATPAEYEAVRAHSNRFLVIAGHELLGDERVVDGNERFLVVEAIGDAAEGEGGIA